MKMTFNIKEIVKDNNAEFEYMKSGYAYYSIPYQGEKYVFPVELADIGNSELKKKLKRAFL